MHQAIEAAKNAEATIIFAGLDLTIDADRIQHFLLTKLGLFNQVADAAKGSVTLVIMSAGGVDISFAKSNLKIKSILRAGYRGEQGGHAIADVVSGK